MTSRIIASFLIVLAAVLVAVVVPLGVIVTKQQSDDFGEQTGRAAQSLAAVAEEHFDDAAPAAELRAALARFATNGYSAAVLDSRGTVIGQSGADIPMTVIHAAATDAPIPHSDDSVIAAVRIGDADRVLGRVVVARDTALLRARQSALWLTLAIVAAGTLAIGIVIAWLLSRWIARPLARLARVVRGVGLASGRPPADDQGGGGPPHDNPVGGGPPDSERVGAGPRADDRTGPVEIRQVAAAFNAMTGRVGTLLDTQRDMTAEVSHQLRGPLAALRLRLELHRDDVPDDQAADITAMIEETGRLARMLDGLLAVARAEAAPPSPARVDLADVASERIAAWQPVAADQGVQLTLDAEPTPADTTPGYVEQILDNLLDNAIGATPAGGRVSVDVAAAATGGAITVTDTGPGMTEEQRLQSVRRWTTDRAGNGGTGLGLTIVTRLIEADHGTLELDDAPAGGLTVRVRYSPPANRDASPRPDRAHERRR